jgi:hypothetical protein
LAPVMMKVRPACDGKSAAVHRDWLMILDCRC